MPNTGKIGVIEKRPAPNRGRYILVRSSSSKDGVFNFESVKDNKRIDFSIDHTNALKFNI